MSSITPIPKSVKDSIDHADLVSHHNAGLRREKLRSQLAALIEEYGVHGVASAFGWLLSSAEIRKYENDGSWRGK